MRKLIAGVVAAPLVLGAAGAVSAAPSTTIKLQATMNARQEVPRVRQPAALGKFRATLNKETRVLTWRLTFRRLSGAATAAHIHTGGKKVAGPVLVPLCAPCTSGQTGSVTLTAEQASTIRSARTYVNVHTAKNPGGEIRGQLVRMGPTKK